MVIKKSDADDMAALIKNSAIMEPDVVGELCTPSEFARLMILSKVCDELASIRQELGKTPEQKNYEFSGFPQDW